jgi:hypothetical protein
MFGPNIVSIYFITEKRDSMTQIGIVVGGLWVQISVGMPASLVISLFVVRT